MPALLLCALITAQLQVTEGEPIEFAEVSSTEAFVPQLAPYGEWLWLSDRRAFRPAVELVGPDFVPYASHGHWVATEAGWSFVSSLPFGWATFHYGRWWLDAELGWVWLPDTVWGPAWVEWRYGGGYAGWAPLPPPVYARLYRPRWFFVQAPWLGAANLFLYMVPATRVELALLVATPVPTRRWRTHTWHAGPPYRDVVHLASVPPERRDMRTLGPPPNFHPAVPVRPAPPPSPPPPRVNVPPPPSSPALPPRPPRATSTPLAPPPPPPPRLQAPMPNRDRPTVAPGPPPTSKRPPGAPATPKRRK